MNEPNTINQMDQTGLSKCLHASMYTDSEVFNSELQKVFAHSWQYVGHVEQVAHPGDYFVAAVAGESLLITHSPDGELNALFNVCAHRAARVADGSGCKDRFSCPYHGWTYDAKGRLLHAANAEHVPGMRIENFALTPCALEVLHGLIFVNLDTACESLTTCVPGLAADLQVYAPQLPAMHFAHRTEALLKTNWKVAVENFSECYHCPLVHRSFFSQDGSTEGGGVDANSYRVDLHGLWHKHHGDAYQQADEAKESSATLDHSEQFAGWWLWPNFAIQNHPGGMVNIRQWQPVSVDKTYVFVDWYLPSNEPNEHEKTVFAEHASGVFAEDIPIVEMVQQGLSSRGYRGGPLMIDREHTVLSEHAVAAIQSLWRDAMDLGDKR